jgi:hypothetical protein
MPFSAATGRIEAASAAETVPSDQMQTAAIDQNGLAFMVELLRCGQLAGSSNGLSTVIAWRKKGFNSAGLG